MKEQHDKKMEVQVAQQKEELYSLANDFININDKDIESIDYTDDYEVR